MKFKVGDEVIIMNTASEATKNAIGAVGIVAVIKPLTTGEEAIFCSNWSKPHPLSGSYWYGAAVDLCDFSQSQKNINKLKKALEIN